MNGSVAIVHEQGINFTVLLVKRGTLNSPGRDNVRNNAPSNFPRPVVLAEQLSNGNLKYHGRNDLVKFLAGVHPSQLPWQNYTV